MEAPKGNQPTQHPRDTENLVVVEGLLHRLDRLPAVLAIGAQLGNERIVVDLNLAALDEASVNAAHAL